MASFADISIRIRANLEQFSSQMQNVDRNLKATGKRMQQLGTQLSVGLTAPLVALGVSSVRAFDKQAKAIAQVESALESTGMAANRTLDQLTKQASDLQNNSLFGDEEILTNVTAQIATFTNITGKQFDRVQQASLDLATRLAGDGPANLKGASIQLGKALNDPKKGLSALGKSGIQFSEDQKAVINALADSGRLAEAQNLILEELEKQYGGAAAAAASAGTGGLKQLSNILGDITEEFGKVIVEAIAPFVAWVKDMALRFQNLSPEVKKFIVIIGGVAAAIGPLVALAGTVLPALVTGFTLLTGPVGLAVAAIAGVGVVIAKNWTPIKKTLVDVANYFIDLYNESVVVRAGVQAIVLEFKNFYAAGKFLFNALTEFLTSFWNRFKKIFKNIGDLFKAVLTGDFQGIKKAISNTFSDVGDSYKDLFKEVGKDFKDLTNEIKQNTEDALKAVSSRKKIKLIAQDVDATEITDAVNKEINKTPPTSVATGSANASSSKGGSKSPLPLADASTVIASITDLSFNNGTGDLASATSTIASTTGLSFDNGETESFEQAQQRIAAMQQRLQELNTVAQSVGSSVAGAFENMASNVVNSFGLASSGMEGFVGGLVQTVTKLIALMLSSSISQAIAGATASGAASGPGAVFTTPAFISTAVGGVLSAFAAIPKFADGGIVSGPTLGLVGEYAGARHNPEVIAPLNKLKNLIEPSNSGVAVIGGSIEAEGSKMKVILSRQDRLDNRRR